MTAAFELMVTDVPVPFSQGYDFSFRKRYVAFGIHICKDNYILDNSVLLLICPTRIHYRKYVFG